MKSRLFALSCAARAGASDRRPKSPRRAVVVGSERLEQRTPLSASPAVVMLSATTSDSQSVTIDYTVNQARTAAQPLQFGVYRSSTSQFGPDASLVDVVTLGPANPAGAPPLDSSGQSALAPGTHQVTLSLPGGLPPFPQKPYVLVVADPSSPAATTNPQETAAFRVYTIGVVTHGGIQDPSWTHGPPWELQTAYMMKHEGYDSVIAYNWALLSSTPGEAIKQSPRLARFIMHAASTFPPSAPVDLQLIGHSEGTVVNTYALVKLSTELTPGLKAGYIDDTLLDPHAANNNVPGKQYSNAGVLGGLANTLISNYQGTANDPRAYVPAIVDQAQVFYQHNNAAASAIYNLWGQVPVVSMGPVVHYYNLSPTGATHSGNTGVALWYRNFIAPTLGDQAPLEQALQLNGRIDAPASVASSHHIPITTVATNQPGFSGTAAPGSQIRLYLGPVNRPSSIGLAAWTRADSQGVWTMTTRRPLHSGRYRAVVNAFSRTLRTRPGLTVVPTAPLGLLYVEAPRGS